MAFPDVALPCTQSLDESQQQEGYRGDNGVYEEDQHQPPHDLPELEFHHGQHGNGPEWLDHIGEHIAPRIGDDHLPGGQRQLFCRGKQVRGGYRPFRATGWDQVR